MPHHKSAIKRMRQDEKRRARNRAVKSQIKTFVKKVRQASSREEALAILPKAVAVIDKAAKKGVIHPRNAARKKSRLMKFVNSLAS